jgi:hypothetical protein
MIYPLALSLTSIGAIVFMSGYGSSLELMAAGLAMVVGSVAYAARRLRRT